MKFIANFDPQVWFNNNAVSVDPEGEQKWDATKYIQEKGFTENVKQAIDKDGYWLDRDDVLTNDKNAPEWVRKWNGPFTITVESAE